MAQQVDLPNVRPGYRWYVASLLFLVGVFNWMDRQILSILLESIKAELRASDSAMGLLTGFAFVSFYALASLPIARLADSYSRRNIIATGLAFWSAMTAMSGYVGSFAQLALARVGVGVGEASAMPAGQSLISDFFPTEKRSAALSVVAVSAPIGLMSAFMIGGKLNSTVGWRDTLFWIGVPGLLLALLIYATLKEPVRGIAEHAQVDRMKYDVRETLAYLWSSRSLRYLTLGASLSTFNAWALFAWSPSFLLRVHQMPTDVSGKWLGLAAGLSGIAGTLLGGFVTQRLALRDERWLMGVPALTNLLGAPFVILFLSLPGGMRAVAMFFGVTFFGPAMIGPLSTVIQGVAKVRMRAFAPAVISMVFNLVGVGCGPLTVGLLSDALAPRFGKASVRYALLFASFGLIAAALAFARGSVYLKADLARARSAT
jgi:Arabinose efflux permease